MGIYDVRFTIYDLLKAYGYLYISSPQIIQVACEVSIGGL
jgi:hypothetical protein